MKCKYELEKSYSEENIATQFCKMCKRWATGDCKSYIKNTDGKPAYKPTTIKEIEKMINEDTDTSELGDNFPNFANRESDLSNESNENLSSKPLEFFEEKAINDIKKKITVDEINDMIIDLETKNIWEELK